MPLFRVDVAFRRGFSISLIMGEAIVVSKAKLKVPVARNIMTYFWLSFWGVKEWGVHENCLVTRLMHRLSEDFWKQT